MSETTVFQNLPLLIPGQTLKYATHNEALQTLDILLHCAVDNIGVQSLPLSASPSARILISNAPDQDLEAHANALANYDGTAWTFRPARAGWQVYDKDSEQTYLFDGENWRAETGGSADFDGALINIAGLGIAATADATNVLSVRGPASLFDSSASHRVNINRPNQNETASLIFNTGYSGRAEIGLTGTGQDTLSVKVSDDGQAWTTALSFDSIGGVETGPLRSGVIVIEKDAVASFMPPVDHGLLLLTTKYSAYPKVESSAILAFDVGGSPQLVTLTLAPKASNLGVTPPNGTTGPEGCLNVAVSTNLIHIENRVGPAAHIRYLIIG